MNSLTLVILDEKAGRPIGNPFDVRTVWESRFKGKFSEVGTGLAIHLAQDMAFHIVLTHPSIYVMGHRVGDKGELVVLVMHGGKTIQADREEPVVFARVAIVEQSVKPIRFVERRKDGKRVIVGGPEEVDDG